LSKPFPLYCRLITRHSCIVFCSVLLFWSIVYWCLFLLQCQGEKFVARLEIAGTSQFKTLNSERVKKRIDLPVQKNLLTKYFCILQGILLLLILISLACWKGGMH
jgi:hypothetical protein